MSEPGRKLNAAWCFSKSRIFFAYQLFPRDPFSVFFSKMRSGKHSHRKPAATKLSNDQLRRHFFSWSNLEKWRQIYKQFIFTYLLMDDFLICVLNLLFINHILSMITRIWSRDSSWCPGSEFESEKVTFPLWLISFLRPYKKRTVSVACLWYYSKFCSLMT